MSSMLQSLLFLLSCALVQAVPSAEQIALARKYAPQYRFSYVRRNIGCDTRSHGRNRPFEQYFPSTIEFFLPFVKVGYVNE